MTPDPFPIARDALRKAYNDASAKPELSRLSGGCLAPVYRARLPGHPDTVVKLDPARTGGLVIEARMLEVLREPEALPVPRVLESAPEALVLEHVENAGGASDDGGAAFGRALARLHTTTRDTFGLGFTSCVGPIRLDNAPASSWAEFYRDRRLAPLVGRLGDTLPGDLRRSIDHIFEHMDRAVEACGCMDEPAGPALVHGDLWGGNALWRAGSIAAVIDPAVSFAHPSTDVGMMRLFGGFPEAAFRAYAGETGHPAWLGAGGIALAQLWPALVHAALFGSSYVGMVADRVRAVGRLIA